ncbi:MAG: hypothetical protein ACRDT4_04615 [Micromonosporaceae bacterium]
MAGIAALFGSEQSALPDLSEGLAARGPDTAIWQEGSLGLAVRAALPMIHTGTGLAAVVEGVTEISRLLDEYAARGAEALVRPGEPYAVAVADPVREALLLARNGEGPALYYAVLNGASQSAGRANRRYPSWTVLAAAEPRALIAAGVAPVPDDEVIGEFVDTGRCDEGAATCFAGIRRVLAGQVVEVTRRGVRVVTVPQGQAQPPLTLPLAVAEAVRHGRLGVRLDTDTDHRLLGAVLAHPSACRPVPAYHPVLAPLGTDPEAEAEPDRTPGNVRREVVSISADQFVADLPSFLTDLGEPVPDLASYLLWACARASMGDADTLLDPTATPGGHHPRVADRIAAHLGVGVRFPLAATPGELSEPDLTAALLERIKDRVYGAFLTAEFASRPWVDASTALARFDRFASGGSADDRDAGWFWRLYLVEQWLRAVVESGGESGDAPREQFAPHAGKELTIEVAGRRWVRFPIRTDLFGPGDAVPKKVAGYVTELVAEARAHPRFRDVFSKPWYVVTAEKVVAVAQRRSYLLWQIRPGRCARTLARMASRTPYGVGSRSAWIMELAIREVGRTRMLLATLVSLLGRPFRRGDAWFERVAGPAVAAIDGPADHSMYPSNLSATLGAADPERVAGEIAEALRLALPADAAGNLRGCVVMDGRETGCQVRGLYADRPEKFFTAAFADNPLGQGGERTPVAVLVQAAAVRRAKRKPAPKTRKQPAVTS